MVLADIEKNEFNKDIRLSYCGGRGFRVNAFVDYFK